MPRPLVALAILFAIVIGAAAVLLYRADRQRVLEMAERSAAPTMEAPAAALDAPAPEPGAPQAAAPEARPAQPLPETATEEPTASSKEPVEAAEGTKPAAPEAAGKETPEAELAAVPEPSTPAGEIGQATGAPTAETSVAESPKVAATETSGPAATLQSPPPDEQVAAVQPQTDAGASLSESAAPTATVGGQASEVASGEPESAPNPRQIAEGGAVGETQTPRVATTETPAASSGPAEEELAAAAQAAGVQAPRTTVQPSEAATPEEQATLAAPSAQSSTAADAAPPVQPAATSNPPADEGPTAAEPTPTEHQAAAADSPAEILVAPEAPATEQSSIAASESGVPTAPANEPSEPSVAASETPTKPIVPEAAPIEEQAAAAAPGEATTEPESGERAATLEEEVAAAQPEAPVSATPPTTPESLSAPTDQQAATEAPVAPSSPTREEQTAEDVTAGSAPALTTMAETPASPPAPTTEPAPDSEQEVAAIEPATPPAATAVPTPSEAAPPSSATDSAGHQAEATAPTIDSPAAPPIPGEAPTIALNIESAASELPQVAIEIPASVPAEELLQSIEITGFEALSSPTDALTAEASVDAKDLSGLAVAGDPQSHEITSLGEAAPGIPDARDVTIKAAEAEDKMLYVAGDAPPGALVRVYADEKLVGEARTDINGVWLLEAEKALPVGEVVFRVEAAPEIDIATTPIVEASAPFTRFADGVVLEPVGAVEAGDDAFALSEAGAPMLSYVIIRRGDNLWRIARRNYGRGIKYQAIYAANRDQIRNPHWIFPGQVFVIPTRDRSWETVSQ